MRSILFSAFSIFVLFSPSNISGLDSRYSDIGEKLCEQEGWNHISLHSNGELKAIAKCAGGAGGSKKTYSGGSYYNSNGYLVREEKVNVYHPKYTYYFDYIYEINNEPPVTIEQYDSNKKLKGTRPFGGGFPREKWDQSITFRQSNNKSFQEYQEACEKSAEAPISYWTGGDIQYEIKKACVCAANIQVKADNQGVQGLFTPFSAKEKVIDKLMTNRECMCSSAKAGTKLAEECRKLELIP